MYLESLSAQLKGHRTYVSAASGRNPRPRHCRLKFHPRQTRASDRQMDRGLFPVAVGVAAKRGAPSADADPTPEKQPWQSVSSFLATAPQPAGIQDPKIIIQDPEPSTLNLAQP